VATAHRERRRKNLVQFTVAVAADELTEIARAGYPEVHSEDEKRAVEALSRFITDMLAASIG
jgi:5,10-methylenetetrahydrofolate reductase